MKKSTLLVNLGTAAVLVAGATLGGCASSKKEEKKDPAATEATPSSTDPAAKPAEGSCGGDKAKEGSCGGTKTP
jgi:uncharacterized low-complexity protein